MVERKTDAPVRTAGIPWFSALLALAVIVSAIGVIYTAHRSRELFRTLEQARREENDFQIEWRQLLLERSTLSAHARVEQIAAEQLQMTVPETETPITVTQ
jgi:cell division protein FtsL